MIASNALSAETLLPITVKLSTVLPSTSKRLTVIVAGAFPGVISLPRGAGEPGGTTCTGGVEGTGATGDGVGAGGDGSGMTSCGGGKTLPPGLGRVGAGT